jgi:hypothetical protein
VILHALAPMLCTPDVPGSVAFYRDAVKADPSLRPG